MFSISGFTWEFTSAQQLSQPIGCSHTSPGQGTAHKSYEVQVEDPILLFVFFLHTKKKFIRSHIESKQGGRGDILTIKYQVVLILCQGLSSGKLGSL